MCWVTTAQWEEITKKINYDGYGYVIVDCPPDVSPEEIAEGIMANIKELYI